MHVIYRRVSQEETENVSAAKSDYSHLTIQQQEVAVMLQCDVISLSHDSAALSFTALPQLFVLCSIRYARLSELRFMHAAVLGFFVR